MAPVPQFIDLPLLIEQRGAISGVYPLALMPRLMELATSDDGCVSFELVFGRDEQGIDFISGHYHAILHVNCQRCLTPLKLDLEGKIHLAVISDANVTRELPAPYEPLFQASGRLSLPGLLEDEILLGLPMSPVHTVTECPSGGLLQKYATKRESPFSVLKGIKVK